MKKSSKRISGSWSRVFQRVGCLLLLCLVIHFTAVLPACVADEGEKMVVHLYFADARNPFLVAETRVIVDPGGSTALGRQIVEELIAGSTEGKLPTVPTGTKLRSFFVLDDGTAAVDFTPALRENHPGGCRLEQLTLFSIVNSLVLNVPEISRVKILIDGAETQTLTGHLALEFPLTADMLLTR
jgi:spore germination protein GerM